MAVEATREEVWQELWAKAEKVLGGGKWYPKRMGNMSGFGS